MNSNRHVSLHRDLKTGVLFAKTVTLYCNGSRVYRSRIIREPLSVEDKALIGDTPIPPKLEKVDL